MKSVLKGIVKGFTGDVYFGLECMLGVKQRNCVGDMGNTKLKGSLECMLSTKLGCLSECMFSYKLESLYE